MKINWQTEPVAIIGLTKALLEVAAGVGLTVSDQKAGAIVAGVTAVVTVLATFFARQQATSPATVAAQQAQTDAMVGGASAALAQAGPVADRARLCPSAPPAATTVGATCTAYDPSANVALQHVSTAATRTGVAMQAVKEAAVPIAVLPDPQFQAALDAYPKLAGKLEPNAGKHKKPDGTVMTVPEYVAWIVAGSLSAR